MIRGLRTAAARTVCIAALAFALGAPAAAQTVCRPNALGRVACLGAPNTGGVDPFDPARGSAWPRLDPAPRSLVPGRRTNSFGDTVIGPDAVVVPDLAAPRLPARGCRTDSFGNLRCR